MTDFTVQIEEAIARLKEQQASLEDKIRIDQKEQTELEEYMKEVQLKTETLKATIIASNQKLKDLIRTISETENGYGKLLTAGNTLMEIVSKNMEEHDFSVKIDS